MNVPIDDQHVVEMKHVDGHPGGHGHIVEQAEPHCPVCHRVMSGGPDQAQPLRVFAAHQPFHGVAYAAGGVQRHVVTGWADNGFRLDVPPARLRQRPDFVDVSGRVYSCEPLPGNGCVIGRRALGR